MTQLRAGVGRVNITPAIGAWLVGFAGRAGGCSSIHDDLLATALVLESGDERVAIVSCDIISVHPELIRQTRELAHAATGIAEDHIMICCSHTHSAPPGYGLPRSYPTDQAYANYLPYRLAGAIQLANDGLQPARIGHATGSAVIGINRREVVGPGKTILGENPDGPVDYDVGVLRIDTVNGTPIASLLNYTCHPVILGPHSLAVSADWVGRTRAVVEAATGVPMLFVQGAAGDINPLRGVQDNYRNCQWLGTILAGETIRVYGSIDPSQDEVRLAAANRQIELPLKPLPDADGETAVSWSAIPDRLDKEFPWTAQVGDEGAQLEVQALAVGDLGFVSAAAEPFVETGLATKADSPFARTFFAGYTNGCVGYVPTAQAYPHRGYEVVTAHYGYRLPNPMAPESEQMLVQACREILKQVSVD